MSELTDLNRDMMLSIDMVPIPTDEAVREVENRLLGVETNITNWQRRQNSNNNFSAVVPMTWNCSERKAREFLDDLTTRDQRMIRHPDHGHYRRHQRAAGRGYGCHSLHSKKTDARWRFSNISKWTD